MKISYNRLKNYLNINLPAEKVADYLTSTGLEVEGLEKTESIPGGLKGVVTGKVLTCEKHPNADKLQITTVDAGTDEPLQIVCGAPNVAAGQYVVVALVGTKIHPADGEPFTIKKAKIRGEKSAGMICAEDELGLGESHAGIMVLPDAPKPGTPAADYFKLETDDVFEIGLTPNRADAASHIGTARDLKALGAVKKELKNIELNMPDVSAFQPDDNSMPIAVEVKDFDLCPRYSGVTLTNLKTAPSPEWLQNTLKSIGLSPINNLVDITNFVMHETGQPLHAFDAQKITGNKVVVQTLPEGTTFKTLDDKERKLDAADLMICNTKAPMCIAGVFGGAESGVSDETTSVFIESAYFNPVSVRKTSKRHGLKTDASFRYERGTDPNITVYALKRAALLMKEIAGGNISSEIADHYPNPVKDFEVTLRFEKLNTIAGKVIPQETVVEILHGLEIKIEKQTGEHLKLKVPPYRVDVTREIDVIEEVMRIYGFDNIEMPAKLTTSLSSAPKPNPEHIRNKLADILAGIGFLEGMSNSLTKEEYYADEPDTVIIQNPLSTELGVMRKTLVYDALEACRFNQNRKNADIKLFEFGRTYRMKNGKSIERETLCMTSAGRKYPKNWNSADDPVDFSYVRGIVEMILERMNLQSFNIAFKESESAHFDFGISVTVNKKAVCELGKITEKLKKSFSLREDVYLAEWNIETLIQLASKAKVTFTPVSKYPAIQRDLALLINKSVTFDALAETVNKTERKILRNINLFDVYAGKNINADKKSYALSLTFRDDEKTLTDKRIEKVMTKIISNLKKEHGAEVRDS